MIVKVCDSIMGSGKTESAITMMNEDPGRRYLFVTPYLDEGTRIKQACPALRFCSPERVGRWSKLEDLESLLSQRRNIVSTHALFAYYRPSTLELIRSGGYTLVLDEVMNVVEEEKVSRIDVQNLFASGAIGMAEDNLHVKWLQDDYSGKFEVLKKKAELGNLLYYENRLLFWALPLDSFEAFDEVYILTYLFRAQMQKYYYEINQIPVQYIGTEQVDGVYRFTKNARVPEYAKHLINLIHILDDEKLNRIGQKSSPPKLSDTSLSSGWYRERDKRIYRQKMDTLSKNLYNVFRHKFGCRSGDALWTTFKEYADEVGARGFKKSFLSCNTRATNAYRDRRYLAYCVNIFMDPRIADYFTQSGATVDKDGYAVSEMVQWIWRSAVRCGEEIWVYVPSYRMRTLLKNWLEELANS